MEKFNKNLINQLINYSQSRGKYITQQQAEEYLHSMADLGDLFVEMIEDTQKSAHTSDGRALCSGDDI